MDKLETTRALTFVCPLPYLLAATLTATIACLSAAAASEPGVATITVVAIDPEASETGPDSGDFFLTRIGGKIDQSLSVTVTLSGTATAGADYAAPPATVTFDPHVPMVNFAITPLADALKEGPETVTLDILPKAGVYLAGDEKRATITIADASSGGSNQATPKPPAQGAPTQPPENPGTRAKESGTPIGQRRPKDNGRDVPLGGRRTGTLVVTIAFDGTSQWSDPRTGANTTTIAHREIEYSVPLEGMYAFGSGFNEIEKREAAVGMMLPIPNRYLVLRPRIGLAGTPCGTGMIEFKDLSRGMAVGDPGMPPLVPFQREIRGGGRYPTGDRTVPERDLCETAVTIDFGKQVIHLRLDGTDSYVKVKDIYNGRHAGTYNRKLEGEDGGHAKRKLTFFDWPLPDNDAPEGYRLIENYIMESGPDHTKYPLTAKVRWKLTMDQNGW